MAFKTLLVLLLTFPSLSPAITFEKCQSLLRRDKNLTPFLITEDEVLNETELEILKDIFNRNSKRAKTRTFNAESKHPLTLNNPFALYADIDSEGHFLAEIVQHHSLVSEDDFKQLKRLLKKLLKRMLEESQEHRILSQVLPNKPKHKVRFFGIRYFLRPGQETSPLKLHRDQGSWLQSVLVVNRHPRLEGGETIIAWPQSPQIKFQDGGFGANHMVVAKHWAPRQEINRMLIFDGHNTFHGTSPFIIPKTRSQAPVFRDVVGIVIWQHKD